MDRGGGDEYGERERERGEREPLQHHNPFGPQMPRSGMWKKGESLGTGAFGNVFLGLNCETGEMLAVKEVATHDDPSKTQESLEQLEQEVRVLRSSHACAETVTLSPDHCVKAEVRRAASEHATVVESHSNRQNSPHVTFRGDRWRC